MIGFQGAGAILQTVASPRKSPIYSVQREDKVVSLTFDTAWGNGQTEDMLNILEQYEVKSTFFVTGEWAQEYPEMVKAMSGQGHDVCNYSDTHPHMPQVVKEQQLAEITGCNEKIKEITGLSPILFRAITIIRWWKPPMTWECTVSSGILTATTGRILLRKT